MKRWEKMIIVAYIKGKYAQAYAEQITPRMNVRVELTDYVGHVSGKVSAKGLPVLDVALPKVQAREIIESVTFDVDPEGYLTNEVDLV